MRLISKYLRMLGAVILLLWQSAAFADQNDPRLNALFDALKSQAGPVEQQLAIGEIWSIWHQSGDEQVDMLMAEGGVAVQQGKYESAEAIYSKVVELAPDFSEGWNRRATLRFNLGDYQGSLEDIAKTIALEPRHFGAFWGKGMILGLQRDLTGAIRAFERMLEITPHSLEAAQRIQLLKQELQKEAV